MIDEGLSVGFNTPAKAAESSGSLTAERSAVDARARLRRIDWTLFVVVLLAALYVLPRWADPNQNSRIDMVLAVVDQSTFRIDDYYHNTVDYARVGDAYYSDKAPGAAFLGIPLFMVMRPLIDVAVESPAGLALAQSSAFRASLNPEGSGVSTGKVRFAAVQMLVAALAAALPTALTAWLLWRLALRFSGSTNAAVLVAIGWAFFSPAFAYSNAVYGHQLAAFLLVAAFALIALGPQRPGAGRLGLVGLLLGYAVITEYPAALAAGAVLLYVAWRLWRERTILRIVWTLLAGCLVAAGWMTYNNALFGGPLALGYSHSELWSAQHSAGFMSLAWPTWDGMWGITFSPFRGLFVLAPWLLLAIPGFIVWWRRRTYRAEWWVTLACAGVWFVFNASSQMWWGGFAVGPRYLLPGLPFLALAAAAALAEWLPRRSFRWLLAALALWSFVATWGLALAHQAYPPDTLHNPLVEYALPAWQSGDLARSLGTLAGLPAHWAILPLFLLLFAGGLTVAALLRAPQPRPSAEPGQPM